MASDLISREALLATLNDLEATGGHKYYLKGANDVLHDIMPQILADAPAVDAIPIDTVAEMLAELFGDECCCNYNDIDEWLPFLCEHSDTCPDVIGKNGCWKQFIKHWRAKKDAVD